MLSISIKFVGWNTLLSILCILEAIVSVKIWSRMDYGNIKNIITNMFLNEERCNFYKKKKTS